MCALPQPPWVYCPKEINDWLFSVHGPIKPRDIKGKRRQKAKVIEDLELGFDLDVERVELAPSQGLKRWLMTTLGVRKVVEHFDIVFVSEKIARALSNARFKNMAEIKIDEEVIYCHPERRKDISETIQLLARYADKKYDRVELVAIHEGVLRCEAHIKIRRVHPERIHAIDIKFTGKIAENDFHRFLNRLKASLPLRDND